MWSLFVDGSALPTHRGGVACGYAARLVGPDGAEHTSVGICRRLTSGEAESRAVKLGIALIDQLCPDARVTLFTDNGSLPNAIAGNERAPRRGHMRDIYDALKARGIQVEWLSRQSGELQRVDALATAAADCLRNYPWIQEPMVFDSLAHMHTWAKNIREDIASL